MSSINFKVFRGQVPRISPRLLAPNYAQRALNCKITSGALDPIAGLTPVATIGRDVRSIFRYRKFGDAGAQDIWLTFPSDSDMVKSPLANDEYGRIYWTSDSHEPRVATYAQAISVAPFPGAFHVLGLPLPKQKAAVSVAGGSGNVETRAYTYTYTNATGEESGPAPASDTVSGFTNGTWNISNLQTAPPNSGTVVSVTYLPSGRARVKLNTVFGLMKHETIKLTVFIGLAAPGGGSSTQVEEHRILDILEATNEIEILRQEYIGHSINTWERSAAFNLTGMKKRIYRSAGTNSQFLYVAEIDVATTTYADTVAATALGELIATANCLPPPKNLTSLGVLTNGCLFGVTENELCLSEPYMPYSWPVANRYAFSGRAVRAIATSDAIVVLTQSDPIIYAGTDPAAMAPMLVQTYAPCASARGAVNVGGGVLYPSYDGLWMAAPGSVVKFTEKLYRESEWKKLKPETFRAVFHDGHYYASFEHEGGRRVFVIDIAEADSSIEVIESPEAMISNELDGELYVAKGGKIFRWDSEPGSSYQADWVSPDIQLGRPTNFSVAQVHADFFEIVPPDNQFLEQDQALIAAGAASVGGSLGDMEFNLIEVNGSRMVPPKQQVRKKVVFSLWYDRELVYSTEVESSRPFVLPGGYEGELVAIGISGSVRVHSVTIAQSTAELEETSK